MSDEDGFKTFHIEKMFFIYVESDRLSECLDYYKRNKFEGIAISRHHGYKSDDINFLKECPKTTAVYLQTEISDISGLYNLKKLRWLLIAELPGTIDLSRFPDLDCLRITWGSNLINLDSCSKLRCLSLGKYNSKSKNLHELPPLENIEELTLTQSTITSLAGIENFPNIKRLELNYLPQLGDISQLAFVAKSLKYLEFDHCKKINYKDVTVLKSLKSLMLSACGEVSSISFIREMPALERFTFVGTNVLNGDMTPLLSLKTVGFLEKKHYSHTQDEIEGLIRKKK